MTSHTLVPNLVAGPRYMLRTLPVKIRVEEVPTVNEVHLDRWLTWPKTPGSRQGEQLEPTPSEAPLATLTTKPRSVCRIKQGRDQTGVDLRAVALGHSRSGVCRQIKCRNFGKVPVLGLYLAPPPGPSGHHYSNGKCKGLRPDWLFTQDCWKKELILEDSEDDDFRIRCKMEWMFPFLCLLGLAGVTANPDSKRLYDDLLSNYNRLIRPVGNNSDRLTVKMGLKLSQLIDVNLKNQIMTTNVWVEQEWNDYKLKWNPDDYGGVDTLHVPSEHIWLPDIVLYNNADGNYEVTIMTKAILHHTGKVYWKPPAIYKSFCEIDVEYFPFDEQTCFMKFGSWTYDGYLVDLRHIAQTPDSDTIDMGIDLQDYYLSVEWDIMRVPAVRNEKFYSCCEEPYPDIIFNITLRRKTLFYTVNLIIPCVGISFLSVLVFYLPSDSGEKVSLCISILLSLTVFFLLLAEIIPPTSLTVPLLGKYLLFTMVLVTLSVLVTIIVLNVNFRSPVTHKMSPWIHRVFIQVLPKFLCIERPKSEDDDEEEELKPPEGILTGVFDVPGDMDKNSRFPGKRFSGDYSIPALPARFHVASGPCFGDAPLSLPLPGADDNLFSPGDVCLNGDQSPIFENAGTQEIEKTIEDARFIAQHVRNKDKFENIEEDWKYVAMVLDRLFLCIFGLSCIIGTTLIIFQAPSLYDRTTPIDIQHSKIAKKKMMMMMMGPEEE